MARVLREERQNALISYKTPRQTHGIATTGARRFDRRLISLRHGAAPLSSEPHDVWGHCAQMGQVIRREATVTEANFSPDLIEREIAGAVTNRVYP